MNRHFFIVVAIVGVIGYGLWTLVSEPDYSIAVVSRESKASHVDENRKKVESDPSSPANWADLAGAYLEDARTTGDQKMYELAKEAADRVLQIDSPHRKRALVIQGEVALSRHQPSAAHAKSEEALAISKDDPDAISLDVRSLLELGRGEEAEKQATRLHELKPSSESIRLRGLARDAVGNHDGAERDLIAAIGLEEKTDLVNAVENRVALAEYYLRQGDLDRARRVIATALKVSDQARLQGLLGEIEFNDGKFDKAMGAFTSAFQKDHDPQYLIAQAKTEKARGRESEFRALIDLAVDAMKAEVANSPAPRKMLLARALMMSAKPGEMELASRLVKDEIASGSKRRDLLELEEMLK